MHCAEKSDGRLVLEGEHLPGWLVWLYFGGIYASLIWAALDFGWVAFVIGCGVSGLLLIGIPFVFFATSSYSRLEIEPGYGVRKYAVYRLTGPHLLLEVAWENLDTLTAEPEIKLVTEDRIPRHSLKLLAQTHEGVFPLARFDGGPTPRSLDEPLRLLQHYCGAKLVVRPSSPKD